MNWHYQVMRHVPCYGDEYYGVHEHYPEFDKRGSWTSDPILTADTLDELKQTLKMIEQDIYKHGVKEYE